MNLLTPTGDGSNTLFNEAVGEHYHSKHGAYQESMHVFIEAGLNPILTKQDCVDIFEVGFGTGLNFLLTCQRCLHKNIPLKYHALEPFPLTLEDIIQLRHNDFIDNSIWLNFTKRYNAEGLCADWPQEIQLKIIKENLEQFHTRELYDLIYFDAFSVRHQPELWTDEIIHKTCNFLKPGGIFVTYAITGKLKRAVIAAGCSIEKLTGAPGKREMLRATKI